MTNTIRTIMVVALVILGALVSLKIRAATPKKPAPQVWTPGCVASVPKSWGAYKGGSAQSGLAFEDSAGTLRFLTNIPCDGTPAVALEIRRTAPNSSNGGN
ncbi:MAG: hypothetical protein ABSF40_07225 [Candidatus Acidiferrales bacterium]